MRTAGILTALGSNIVELSVAPDNAEPGLSQMVIVADLEDHQQKWVVAKLNRLVNVLSAVDVTEAL